MTDKKWNEPKGKPSNRIEEHNPPTCSTFYPYKRYDIEIKANTVLGIWESNVYSPKGDLVANMNSPDRKELLRISKYYVNHRDKS